MTDELMQWLVGSIAPKKKDKAPLKEAGDFFNQVASTAATIAFVCYAGNWVSEILSGKKKL
jgi:hypothetical protein